MPVEYQHIIVCRVLFSWVRWCRRLIVGVWPNILIRLFTFITLVVYAVSLDLCTWHPCRKTSDWQHFALSPEALCVERAFISGSRWKQYCYFFGTTCCLHVELAITSSGLADGTPIFWQMARCPLAHARSPSMLHAATACFCVYILNMFGGALSRRHAGRDSKSGRPYPLDQAIAVVSYVCWHCG